MFAGVVLRVKPPQPKTMAAIILKGILIGIAVVSLVGIPTQNMAVAITFWTFAFWYASLSGVVDRNDSTTSRIAPRTWIAIWALVATSVGGTFYTARHYLRVPQRATIGAWPFYYYGLSDKKENAEFEHASESWVGRHAVWVLVPTTRWVKLTLSVDRLNLAKGPVEIKLACDNEPTVTARVRDAQPITRYVRVREGRSRMMVEAWASRYVRPDDYGLNDERPRGVLVEWDFVDGPPAAATAASQPRD
jgi:hypothetical protein